MKELETESREKVNNIPKVFVFDVDGVLTDPQEKRVTEPELFDIFIAKLEYGEPVICNTGRSLVFIENQITTPLKDRMLAANKPLSLLSNVYAVGEKGGIELEFTQDGLQRELPDSRFSVPLAIQKAVEAIVTKKYAHSTFYDKTKRTMVSTEMQDGYELVKFHLDQQLLIEDLAEILERFDPENKYKIDPTTIATDVEDKRVGKALGAQKALAWLARKNIHPSMFVTVGDSKSDIDMAHAIHAAGLSVLHVNVGKDITFDEQDFQINTFTETYTQGVVRFLKESM